MIHNVGDVVYITTNLNKLGYDRRSYAGNRTIIRYVGDNYYKCRNISDFYFEEDEITDVPPKSAREYASDFNIDYESLHKEIMDLYLRFGHHATNKGIDELLRHYFLFKEEKIKLIMSHPNYNGNLQIVFPIKISRFPEENEVRIALDDILEKCDIRSHVLSYVDDENHDFHYNLGKDLKELAPSIKLKDLSLETLTFSNSSSFDSEHVYRPSKYKFDDIVHLFDYIEGIDRDTISNYEADNIMGWLKKFDLKKSERISGGMKTSRVINRIVMNILKYSELDNDDASLKEFRKLFAKYSDIVNANEVERLFVISLNPLDYLTMSFGNTWSSCHTIDSHNLRGTRLTSSGTSTYTGMHMGGTLSYMLDSVSFVSYAVDKDADRLNPNRTDKIYRNMFHFDKNVLIQGRMYPQSKDGCTDLYKVFRDIIEKTLCECLNIEFVTDSNGNDTWIKKGRSRDYRYNQQHTGAHYHDTESFNDCSISYIRGFWDDNFVMDIGNRGVCANCGETITYEDAISHGDCDPLY